MSQTDRPHDAHAALDRAIEHALRQIVQVDPPDRLAERVLARIASNDRRTPFRFHAAVGVGLAAAAALVLAVVLRSPADHVRTDRAATTSVPADSTPRVETTPPPGGQTGDAAKLRGAANPSPTTGSKPRRQRAAPATRQGFPCTF